MKNPYAVSGLFLCIAGVVFAPIAYGVADSVPLTATAISAIIVGLASIAIGATAPAIPTEAFRAVLKSSMKTTSALLQGLDLQEKALYMPTTMTQGHAWTVVPLRNGGISAVQGKIPARLATRYGTGPHDVGIAVTTLGSASLDVLRTRPGPAAAEIESAISYLLTGVFDLADSAIVDFSSTRINSIDVIVKGARLPHDDGWYYHCLGSPIGSVAAAVCSEALGRPTRVQSEANEGRATHITIEVVG